LNWIKSHPAGVRGLKLNHDPEKIIGMLSHPAGVRGLKLKKNGFF